MKSDRTWILRCILAAAVVALMGACYRHTIRESGPGGKSDRVYEPNVKEKGDAQRR